ncbi:Transcriptional regulator, TetR family protein [Ketogulonicigenium vulgare]|uniref:Transcriptional regulator, TetR family protein n=2 Tax=Ketogulonicigenium vulgare TaxID=92945 RepID=F9Y4M7_KETVW|nr:Transcriptional regulator, TetR family protein [Ketogulonicigenium vulgare WSH-001]ALJ82287.1 TetR family transcriptional regulator [Ketogulonicigenium vulgare]AOZ54300.1 Transcriptional regulator, TetR family protein [Ketogulonicigenium vulgare]
MDGVSVDELIQKVGGSRRNIYNRFGDKQGLFVEVITKLCDCQAAPLREMEIAGGDLVSALQSFGERLLQIVLQPRTLALHRLMIAEGQRFPELSRAISASGHEAGVAVLVRWLLTREEDFRPNLSVTSLAELFVTLLVSKAQRDALTGMSEPLDSEEIAAIARQAVSVFLHGALMKDA